MAEGEIPVGDPRILENPLEASLELAGLAQERLPALRQRSLHLLLLGIAWSVAVAVMAAISSLYLRDLYRSGEALHSVGAIVYLSLIAIFIPSIGLGIALLILAVKERQFLPFLDKASGALSAIEGKPSGEEGAEPAPPGAGAPLAGIIGSAISIGRMVPTAEGMAAVARAVLAMLLAGLVYLLALVAFGILLGAFTIALIAAELAVFALFVVPSVLLLGRLSRDLEFYRYYSRRHRALSEMAALGPPPVPEGRDHLARFERFLRSVPAGKGLQEAAGSTAESGVAVAPFDRLYRAAVDGVPSNIILKLFREMPTREELDRFLADARAAGKERGLVITRAVALITTDVDDIDDAVYEHVLELGRKTGAEECALQMVMEVGGAYSMVPYIAS